MEEGLDNTPAGAAPGRDESARPGRGELALELRGRLPCCRCAYDLGGLSIRGVCPECGTPIRATLLVVVDPHARELQRVAHPGLVAAGMMAWAVGGLGAAILAWWFHVGPTAARWMGEEWPTAWARTGAVWLMAVSGVGALALVRPHARIPRWQVWAAGAGVAGLLGLAVLSRWVWGSWPPGMGGSGITGRVPDAQATLARLAQAAVVGLVIVLLRPNARVLAARSLLLRSGRVDRQTMYAMAAAVGVVMAGQVVNLVAPVLGGRMLDVALSAGAILVVVGWGLVTAGLVGVVVDVVRLCPVLLEPSPSLRSLLVARGGERAGR